MQITINNTQKIIIYKILKNILNTFLIVWALALVVEILIPGFISNYLSFSKIIIILYAIIIAFYFLSKHFELKKEEANNAPLSKVNIVWGISLIVLITSIALINFSLPIIVIITALTILILFYFYKNLN